MTDAEALWKKYQLQINEAVRNRQIFAVYMNHNAIRLYLHKAGWLEKLPSWRFKNLQRLSTKTLLNLAKPGNNYEIVLLSKMLKNVKPFLIYQPSEWIDRYEEVRPLRNRIRRKPPLDFSSKVGLIACAQQQQWLSDHNVSITHPRFFYLSGIDCSDISQFIGEYLNTMCRSVLRFLLSKDSEMGNLIKKRDNCESIPLSHLQIALARCQCQLENLQDTNSIDKFIEIDTTWNLTSEWQHFIKQSNKLIKENYKIDCSLKELSKLMKSAKSLLQKIDQLRPDYKWDGYRNLWILKPGYENRGVGIVVRNQLQDILSWTSSHSVKKYIVQKYIETPLLIYNTKFDIRQYMLICCRQSTLQIWLYHECYFRLSSCDFNMDDFREVIHLTNFTIQKKYNNEQDFRLPQNNMWTLQQFKQYLKEQQFKHENINVEKFWIDTIFSGFRKNLIAAVLASLDDTELHENCFELFGCDFMLAEDYTPILIEINANPDLTPSTEITARLCSEMLEDAIKVVIDGPRLGSTAIGQYELVYEVDWKYRSDKDAKKSLHIIGRNMEEGQAQKPATLKRYKVIVNQKSQKTVSTIRHRIQAPAGWPQNSELKLNKNKLKTSAVLQLKKNDHDVQDPEPKVTKIVAKSEIVTKHDTKSSPKIKEAAKKRITSMLPASQRELLAIYYTIPS